MVAPLPGDPPHLPMAAAILGKLVAQQILEPADLVPRMLAISSRAGYRGCLLGLQARLHWRLNDAADHWRRRRHDMRWTIRRNLRPMLGVASGSALLEAADRTNMGGGEPLLWREVKQVVEEELTSWFRTQTRTRRYVR